jgi:hypothetical protein
VIKYKQLILTNKTMSSPEMGPSHEKMVEQNQSTFANRISVRANGASGKVRQRVEEAWLPKLKTPSDERGLLGYRNDFYALAKNPNDEVGAGHYEGWTPAEIEELYRVLYGEEMEKD